MDSINGSYDENFTFVQFLLLLMQFLLLNGAIKVYLDRDEIGEYIINYEISIIFGNRST
jgi:hypothetical protein